MFEGKGFWESLVDFSFRDWFTPRRAKLLYALHLFAGLVVAIALVLSGFRDSTSQGLLVLILAVIGLFFWMLYCRVAIEILLAVFRIADGVAATEPSQPMPSPASGGHTRAA